MARLPAENKKRVTIALPAVYLHFRGTPSSYLACMMPDNEKAEAATVGELVVDEV
jgi:hypothetical protein